MNPPAGKSFGVGWIEVRQQVVLLGDGSKDVVAKPEIERQPAVHAPVVLNEFADLPITILGRRKRHVARRLVVVAGEQ